MAGVIGATSRPIRELPAERVVCARCGLERATRRGRTPAVVCRDCKGCLNQWELERWAA